MSSATLFSKVGRIKAMQEFEYGREEAVLVKDDAWRRLFARVNPQVRRDMIAWLGLAQPTTWAAPDIDQEAWQQICKDYVTGASLVVDQLPNLPYEYCTNDREAILADFGAVSNDVRCVYDALASWIGDRKVASDRPAKVSDAAFASGRPKSAAA